MRNGFELKALRKRYVHFQCMLRDEFRIDPVSWFQVFEYFASVKTPSGEMYMTPADLMRAIVPVFPSSEADTVRGGYLNGDRFTTELHCPPSKFFMLFDTNNDGVISFPESVFGPFPLLFQVNDECQCLVS